MKRIAFLGCSRGLGKEVLEAWDCPILAYAFARSLKNLEALEVQSPVELRTQSVDFSKEENLVEFVEYLESLNLDSLFYFAAGGPYGSYVEKKWKDHLWALQVSFLTPAYLLQRLSKIQQMVFIGSSIADSQADPKAASYAAAKHGLKGLVTSLIAEGDSRDLRLFRPGYMDTDLLPPGSPPRQGSSVILSPKKAAQVFVPWVKTPDAERLLSLDS